MNKHILLVMKWLKNPESVSQEELDANCESAYSAYWAAYTDDSAYWAAYYAYSTARSAYSVAAALRAAVTRGVSHWVDRYFQITGENKEEYEHMVVF
jgi:hypothetical protein